MILYDTRLNQRFDSVMHPVVLLACWPHICISQSFELKCTSEIDHSSDLTRISDSGHVRHHVTVSKTAQAGLEKQTAVVQSQPQPALHLPATDPHMAALPDDDSLSSWWSAWYKGRGGDRKFRPLCD